MIFLFENLLTSDMIKSINIILSESFAAIQNGSYVEIKPYQIEDSQWKAVIYQGPPFYIQFYNDLGTLAATLRGDRFSIQNVSCF